MGVTAGRHKIKGGYMTMKARVQQTLKVVIVVALYVLIIGEYTMGSLTHNFKYNEIASWILIIGFQIITIMGFILIKNETHEDKRRKATAILLTNIVFLLFITITNNVITGIYRTENKNAALLTIYHMNKNQPPGYKKSFKTIDYNGNNICYTDPTESVLGLITASLDEGKEINNRLFSAVSMNPVNIKLHYNNKVFKNGFKDGDAQGYYVENNETIHLYAQDGFNDVLNSNNDDKFWEFRNALLHEYTHHITFNFMNKQQVPLEKIPAWFIEGIAEYGSSIGGIYGQLPMTDIAMVPISELNTNKQWIDYCNMKICNPYLASYCAVKEMVVLKGEAIIENILLRTKEVDFNEAFKDAMGIPLIDYERNLMEDSKNQWKEYTRVINPLKPNDYTDLRIQCLKKYIDTNDTNVDAVALLAGYYENLGENYEAIMLLKDASEKEPNDVLLLRKLAAVYANTGQIDEAINTCQEELRFSEDKSKVYLQLASILLMKDFNEAKAMALKAQGLTNGEFIQKEANKITVFVDGINSSGIYWNCSDFIRNSEVLSKEVRAALINKVILEYPQITGEQSEKLRRLIKE